VARGSRALFLLLLRLVPLWCRLAPPLRTRCRCCSVFCGGCPDELYYDLGAATEEVVRVLAPLVTKQRRARLKVTCCSTCGRRRRYHTRRSSDGLHRTCRRRGGACGDKGSHLTRTPPSSG